MQGKGCGVKETAEALLESNSISVQLSPPSRPEFNKWQIRGGIYVHDESFVMQVLNCCNFFEAITFTAHGSMLDKCSRLICAKLLEPNPHCTTAIRYGKNIHTKLYRVHSRHHQTIWIGSMNLVRPGGWHNVMMQVDVGREETFALYFERLWSLCESK